DGDPEANPGTVEPTLTGFSIGRDGSLAPVPNSTVTLPLGTVPSQNLISRDGPFLFSDIFAINDATHGNTIAPVQSPPNGTLNLPPGGNVDALEPGSEAARPSLLGAAVHPRLNIVYAGLVGTASVAVFTYDETGRLSFVDAADPNRLEGSATC